MILHAKYLRAKASFLFSTLHELNILLFCVVLGIYTHWDEDMFEQIKWGWIRDWILPLGCKLYLVWEGFTRSSSYLFRLLQDMSVFYLFKSRIIFSINCLRSNILEKKKSNKIKITPSICFYWFEPIKIFSQEQN